MSNVVTALVDTMCLETTKLLPSLVTSYDQLVHWESANPVMLCAVTILVAVGLHLASIHSLPPAFDVSLPFDRVSGFVRGVAVGLLCAYSWKASMTWTHHYLLWGTLLTALLTCSAAVYFNVVNAGRHRGQHFDNRWLTAFLVGTTIAAFCATRAGIALDIAAFAVFFCVCCLRTEWFARFSLSSPISSLMTTLHGVVLLPCVLIEQIINP